MRDEKNKPMLSHPVRQYDQPMVSIVIPVGKGHEEILKNALDSCESQTYRRWEAIVIFDNGMSEVEATSLLSSYPYVRIGFTPPQEKGAGKARNVGVELSRAPFLVFLDADDMLAPEFLDKTISVWHEAKAQHDDGASRFIIYSDYVRKTTTTQEDLNTHFKEQNILQFIEKTGEAVIAGRSADYDCERAQRQPEFIQRTDPFHWSLVTCLVPKVWHDKIGGFDENMESFEDVLYHWMMARHGMCYIRIPEELVMYRMYTGTRRERASIHTDEGRIVAKSMLEYAEKELEKIPMAGCSKCPDKGVSPSPKMISSSAGTAKEVQEQRAQDEDYVLCEYMHPNRGNHQIYGAATKEYYGYKGGGRVFLVHKKDIEAQPQFFRPIRHEGSAPIPEVQVPQAPTPIAKQIPEPVQLSTEGTVPEYIAPKVQNDTPSVEKPEKIEPTPSILPPPALVGGVQEVQDEKEAIVEKPPQEELPQPELPIGQAPGQVEADEDVFNVMQQTKRPFNLELVPGVTPHIKEQLEALGKDNRQAILDLGMEGLQKLTGVGEVKAAGILEWLSQE
jgi:glycosyltransferase involved in cell wall biosynthesis